MFGAACFVTSEGICENEGMSGDINPPENQEMPRKMQEDARRSNYITWGVGLLTLAVPSVVQYFGGPSWAVFGVFALGVIGLFLLLRAHFPHCFKLAFWTDERVGLLLLLVIAPMGTVAAYVAARMYFQPIPFVFTAPSVPSQESLLRPFDVPTVRVPRQTGQTAHSPGSAKPELPPPSSKTPTPQSDLVLSVSLITPTAPAIIIENQSDGVADGVRWELVMVRTSDQAFLSYATQNIGYVKAHSKSAPQGMPLNRLPNSSGIQIANGDHLIGTLSIDCPLCKGNTLVVSFVWGSSGWFREVPNGNGGLVVPPNLSKDAVSRYIDLLSTDKSGEQQPIR